MADIDKQALEYLVQLGEKVATPIERVIDGRTYVSRNYNAFKPPTVTPIEITTLSSLILLCSEKFERSDVGKYLDGSVNPNVKTQTGFEGFDPAKHLIHVKTPEQVQIVSALSNTWKDREVLINCELAEEQKFPFAQFMEQEKFIIGLLSCFVDTPSRAALAKLAGNATAESIATVVDDGITQMISQRSGAAVQESKTIKGIVSLAPYRTFRDIDQPKSDFLFRVRKQGEVPAFALFEADGGAWKFNALEDIARKLSAGIKDGIVVS